MPDKPKLELIASVVVAYVKRNHVEPAALADLITAISAAFGTLGPPPHMQALYGTTTGAQVRKSITYHALISFEDGKAYKMLRRHLSLLGMTPAEYRAKWGLPPDYPMTAPGYSAARSAQARASGRGHKATRRPKGS